MNGNLGAFLTTSNLTNMKGNPETYPFLWQWHGMSGFLTTQALNKAERVSGLGLGQDGDAGNSPGDTGAPNSPDDVGAAVNQANAQQLTTTIDDITDAAVDTSTAVIEGAQNYVENQIADGIIPPPQEAGPEIPAVIPAPKETPWLLYGGIAAGVLFLLPMLKRGTRKGMFRKTARRAYR